MTMAYSEEQKKSAKALLDSGSDILEVHVKTGIPLDVLCRWFKLRAAQPGKRQAGGGRKVIIDDEGLKILREIVESNGKMTLDELAAAFAERTSKTVGAATIASAMKKLGFRKVKCKKAASKPATQTPPRYTDEHRREPTATSYRSTLTDLEWAVIPIPLHSPQCVPPSPSSPRRRGPSVNQRFF